MAHRFYLLSIQDYLPTSVFQDFDNHYTGNFQPIVSITNQVDLSLQPIHLFWLW